MVVTVVVVTMMMVMMTVTLLLSFDWLVVICFISWLAQRLGLLVNRYIIISLLIEAFGNA